MGRPSPPRDPGGLRIVPERGRGAATIYLRANEPISAPTRWIDQREASRSSRHLFWGDEVGKHVSRSSRERGPQREPVSSDRPLDLVAREQQQPCRDASRPPSELSSHLPGGSFVPAQLTLDGTNVVETGLDLDDQKRPAARIECKQIDPVVRSPVAYLDLSRSGPSRRDETSIDVARAMSVYDIPLESVLHEERRSREKVEFQAQGVRERLDESQRRVGSAALHLCDVASRDTDSIGDLLSGEIEPNPRVEASGAEADAERLTREGCDSIHAAIEAAGAQLALITGMLSVTAFLPGTVRQ